MMQINLGRLLVPVSSLLPWLGLLPVFTASFNVQSQTEPMTSQLRQQEPTVKPSRLGYFGVGYLASNLRQPFALPSQMTPKQSPTESVTQTCSPSDSKQVNGLGQSTGLILRGVLGTPQRRIALLQTSDGQSLQVTEGDRLDAQGSKVARVMSNRVEIAQVGRDQNGCIQTRTLTLTLDQR
ncbi:pilus assembly protein PilP [Vibrio sp. WXL210]|uniref:pilus assembly protein PilP n=1 Tax=Vibrio sp. WXL210 TaxID=3450709 RepID=UPI003EC7A8C7